MKNKSYVIWVIAIIFAACFLLVRSNRDSNKISEEQLSSTPISAKKTYTLAEVSTHNNKSDCWLAVEGSVYDVTKFVDQHPGGEEILKGCGKDATSLFNSVPNHADQGRELLPSYVIGKLQ
jgi:cytochrome b involved in lipid metabolism